MHKIILLLTLSLLPLASAHFPYIVETETSLSDPIIIDNIQISQVWYFTQDKPTSDIWLKFTIEDPDQLFVQIGVPVLDKLENYNPTLEIYHEHEISQTNPHEHNIFTTNFDKPSETCTSNSIRTVPCIFHESFTDTYSWILAEDRIQLEPGTYYLHGKSDHKGTMWIAVGEIEDFSLLQLPYITDTTSAINNAHGKEESNTFTIIAVVLLVALITFIIYRRRNS